MAGKSSNIFTATSGVEILTRSSSETKNQPKDRSFRPDVPADIRPKTSVRPSKSWKNKRFGTDMPRGRPQKKLRSEKLRADFSFPVQFKCRLKQGPFACKNGRFASSYSPLRKKDFYERELPQKRQICGGDPNWWAHFGQKSQFFPSFIVKIGQEKPPQI